MKAVFKMRWMDVFRKSYNTGLKQGRRIPAANQPKASTENDLLKQILFAHPYSTDRSNANWRQLIAAFARAGLVLADTAERRATVDAILDRPNAA